MPLVLDGTTGFNLPLGAEIGVGTNSPAGNGLHVDHTAGATLRLTRLGTSTSHFVQLETDGAHGTLRSEGDLTLDSDNGNWRFKDGGTSVFEISRDSNTSVNLYNAISDSDIIIKGNDGGSPINALTLDMSNLGFASFNANAFFNESASDVDFRIKSVNQTNMFYVDASTDRIGIRESSPDTLLHISGAPDNKVITIDQNGRASAIGTYFSSDAIGSRIDFYISNGNTNGDSNNRMSILGSGNVGIGTIGPVSSGYDTGSKKLTVMSDTLNNATSGYLELASRANTAGYNAGAIQFNNFENAGTAGTGTQNRTVGQIRTVITTTDSNAGDDSGGTMQFWTKPEAQALANTMRISTEDPNHRADVTVDATGLAGDGGTNANAFFNAKAKGNYYAGLDIKSNSGHVGGWIGHWNGSSTDRQLQARVGGNGLNSSDYVAIRADYLGRVTHPNRPHFRARGFSGHYYVNSIQSAEANRLRGFKHIDVNRGSHWDNSTGKFTIPVTGDYAFYCTVMFTNPNTMDFHLSFQLNGTVITASNDHNGGGSGQGHQWNGSSLAYSGYFSANDYVGFAITGGGSTSTTYLYGASVYSVVGGYLL